MNDGGGAGRRPGSPRVNVVHEPIRSGHFDPASKSKIEQQLVIRLPERLAAEIRKRINEQTLSNSAISIHPIDARNMIFRVDAMGDYPGTLVDLPCIIESLKTWDGGAYYKSADICQMLLVREIGDTEVPPIEHPSGLAPPTAHIRERRFRKPQFPREEIVQAESHLWNILQGQPQVHYELIEEDLEVPEEEEEEEEEFESGDEWEDDEEEEEDGKWPTPSGTTGGTASVMRNMSMSTNRDTPMSLTRGDTPGSELFSPGRFAVPSTGPMHRPLTGTTPSLASTIPGPQPSTPGPQIPTSTQDAWPSSARPTSVSSLPSRSPAILGGPVSKPSTPMPAPSLDAVMESVVTTSSLAEGQPQLPTPGPWPTPAPAAEDLSAEESPEDKQKQALRLEIEAEIVELEARIQDLTEKTQTANKILKKRFTKSLEEAQQALRQKQAVLAAL